ncbi:unnamed protein product [Candidula unifasciata]|uniref:EF-hand domain-containing protein n=1 Tax=Candidula unifasciata TaxID=100452 RepID=A0A8S3ZHJ5_9EUPU|nr:unnamed protein product [Candidula unifasciata]
MYQFLLLLLLPALAMAGCNKEIMKMFFERVDADDNQAVDRAESDAFFKMLDTSEDKILTIPEIKEVAERLVPELKDDVDDLFDVVDVNRDKVVTQEDVDGIFLIADKDRNNAVSKEEFDTLSKLYLLLECTIG